MDSCVVINSRSSRYQNWSFAHSSQPFISRMTQAEGRPHGLVPVPGTAYHLLSTGPPRPARRPWLLCKSARCAGRNVHRRCACGRVFQKLGSDFSFFSKGVSNAEPTVRSSPSPALRRVQECHLFPKMMIVGTDSCHFVCLQTLESDYQSENGNTLNQLERSSGRRRFRPVIATSRHGVLFCALQEWSVQRRHAFQRGGVTFDRSDIQVHSSTTHTRTGGSTGKKKKRQ